MKEFFGDKKEWAASSVGIIITIIAYFIVNKIKVPMYVLGIIVFLFIIIIWRMYVIIIELKQKAHSSLSVEKIIDYNGQLFVLLTDRSNVLTTNSYFSILIDHEGLLTYIGTAYITGNAANRNQKQAIILHSCKSNEELKKINYNRLHISLAIQHEYIDNLKHEYIDHLKEEC